MRRQLLPLALAALALAACDDATAPDRPTALPLSLRVVPARTSVVSGDTVTVRLTARNLGSRPVTIDNEFASCVMGLRLQSPSGEPLETIVFRPASACPPGGPITLAPGDSLVESGTWEAGILFGGDVFMSAEPGPWTLHPIVYSGDDALPGTLDVPATVTVVSR